MNSGNLSISKAMEIESFMIKRRSSKTCVYDGNQRPNSHDNLGEVSYNVVNIFRPEIVKEVPFKTLKPVLMRLNPLRLKAFEKVCPHLLSQIDCLWEMHCKREFRNQLPLVDETWRAFYARVSVEREVKLKFLKAKINASQAKIPEARKAKIIDCSSDNHSLVKSKVRRAQLFKRYK